MTLYGKRVVVTRAPHQAEPLTAMLRDRGAEPLLFPCIDIVPPHDTSGLDYGLRQIESFDWLILTSTNTVMAIKKRLDELGLSPDFNRLKVAAVGRKTATFFERSFKMTVTVVPERQDAGGLIRALPAVYGQQIFLPQSEIARDVLYDELDASDAKVTAVTAYRTVTGTGGVPVEHVRYADAITFTSSSTVTGFVERVGGWVELPTVCIGEVTGITAMENGFPIVTYPGKDYTLRAMVDVLEDIFCEE